MKRFLLILGGIAMFFVFIVTVVAWYLLGNQEKDKNRSKTAAARDARWKPKNAQDAEVIQEEQTSSNGHGTAEDLKETAK